MTEISFISNRCPSCRKHHVVIPYKAKIIGGCNN